MSNYVISILDISMCIYIGILYHKPKIIADQARTYNQWLQLQRHHNHGDVCCSYYSLLTAIHSRSGDRNFFYNA